MLTGVRPVLVQEWAGVSPVPVQMWAGVSPSPCADGGGVRPVPAQMSAEGAFAAKLNLAVDS